MSSNSKKIFVVPLGTKRWAVKKANNPKPLSIHNKKPRALEKGKKIADKNKGELTILKRIPKTRIQNKNSFGPDKCPPKDKRN